MDWCFVESFLHVGKLKKRDSREIIHKKGKTEGREDGGEGLREGGKVLNIWLGHFYAWERKGKGRKNKEEVRKERS